MCGIAGIWLKESPDQRRLDRAEAHFRDRMAHRGPDAVGVHRITNRALFLNLRLSIVDRGSRGNQPFFSNDKRRGIIYNGEVYNWPLLRKPLESHFSFSSQTDTEVVLACYLEYGEDAFEKFNGMFGLCIWDEDTQSFVLARDRFGAKPLYVYEDAHCIAFSSELRGLLGLEGLDLSPDPVGFQDYLTYRYNLAPRTLFKRIEKLPAGHLLRFSRGQRIANRAFTQLEICERQPVQSIDGCVEELDSLIQNSVKQQLMGEAPIGVLLSGGVDSSGIAAYVNKIGSRLTAYSIGFPEVNEFRYSREVARHFDLNYVEVTLTQDELRQKMDRVLYQLDEPIADPACFALSELCARVKKDVTVVLSGEGSDELFAGYRHHAIALDAALSHDQIYAHFLQYSGSNLCANEWLRDKDLPLHHLRFRAKFDSANSPLSGMQTAELHTWLPENLMMKADKITMAHSLEGRFPFLDNDILAFASRLPRELKITANGTSKYVLRKLMDRYLPASVLDRPKMGFTVPPAFFLVSMRNRLLATIDTLQSTAVREILDLDAIANTVRLYYEGSSNVTALKVWNIAVLLVWWTEVLPSYFNVYQKQKDDAYQLPDAPGREMTVTHRVLCDGGLSNRLNALLFALVLRERFGGNWRISWPLNNWCGARFQDLFTCDLEVDELGIHYYKTHQHEHLLLMHENQLDFDSSRLVINRDLRSFEDYERVFSRATSEGVGIVYYNSLIPAVADEKSLAKALSLLQPNQRVARRASEFCVVNSIDPTVTGVHIRKTDFGDKVDDDSLFEALASSSKRFFVCSDDPYVNERFGALPNCSVFRKTAFPEKMQVHTGWQQWTKDAEGRSFPFNVSRSSTAVIEGFIDQLILSRTNIMTTSGSTFQQTARFLGDNNFLPVEQVLPNSRQSLDSAGVKLTELFQLLDLIRPWQMRSMQKVRMGALADGGYVMPTSSLCCNLAVSIGIGEEVSFDDQLCQQGATVLQFDHTIEKSPSKHPNAEFHALGWGTSDLHPFLTLNAMMSMVNWVGTSHPILKFDTEGAEWDCLSEVSSDDLAKFEVIAGEFHQFDRLPDRHFFDKVSAVFYKLCKTHRVVHLHANNAGGMVMIGGIPFPRLLELTWVRIESFSFYGHSNEPIPGPLDYPNIPQLPDLHLRAF